MEYKFIVMTPRHTQKCIFIRDQFFDKNSFSLSLFRHPPQHHRSSSSVRSSHVVCAFSVYHNFPFPIFFFLIVLGSHALWYWINSGEEEFLWLLLFSSSTPSLHPSPRFRPPSFATLHRGSEKICNFLEWSQILHPLTPRHDMTARRSRKMSNI